MTSTQAYENRKRLGLFESESSRSLSSYRIETRQSDMVDLEPPALVELPRSPLMALSSSSTWLCQLVTVDLYEDDCLISHNSIDDLGMAEEVFPSFLLYQAGVLKFEISTLDFAAVD